jgi:methionyl-tRNA synthetase
MSWGIDVPDDPGHVMYVWFDALINYISAIGWPDDPKKFTGWWPVVQFAGKDNLRQQSAIWQAMLLSAKLPPSKQIFIHGFVSVNGQKISKSLGNTVDPYDLVKKYGTDALRYYLLREIPAYDDGDFSERRFKELYNSDLANGLGNVTARIAKLCELNHIKTEERPKKYNNSKYLDLYEFSVALEDIWKDIKKLDVQINHDKPWETKDTKKLQLYINQLIHIAVALQPFLPDTAQKILDQFKGPAITSKPPLFPRIQ